MNEHFAFLPYIISGFVGIGLAAASGFRVFLPMFAVSLGLHFGWISSGENFHWLSGLPALITTGIATIVEIFAYYIPYIDHVLDIISIPAATIAGSIMFASQFADLSAFPHWGLAIIAGGGTAAAISSGFAGTRAASTVTTAGLGNSMVATSETFGAGLMSFLALALPVIAFIVAILLVIAVIYYGKKLFRKFRGNNKKLTVT
jgi:hypothetical protein